MSEGVKEENQLYDEINITPMLDLAYVLLVIFIIMTTASVQGVKVESPQTTASAPLAKPQMRAITITSDGAVYLDAYPVDMATLEQRLAEYKSGNPELPVRTKRWCRYALRESVRSAWDLQKARHHRGGFGH